MDSMLILTIRTNKPEAELGLYQDDTQVAYTVWQAHRLLAETIHLQIKSLLDGQRKKLQDVEGIVAFKGPGSFTGLRIGLSVANALATSLPAPIVSTKGDDWIKNGAKKLASGDNENIGLPEYGSAPHVTQPK